VTAIAAAVLVVLLPNQAMTGSLPVDRCLRSGGCSETPTAPDRRVPRNTTASAARDGRRGV